MRLRCRAKTGLNVATILEAVVTLLPPPQGDPEAPLQALIFDRWFDPYRGVIVLARIINGRLRKGMKIKVMSNGKTFDVESMGVMTPKPVVLEELTRGRGRVLRRDDQERRGHEGGRHDYRGRAAMRGGAAGV